MLAVQYWLLCELYEPDTDFAPFLYASMLSIQNNLTHHTHTRAGKKKKMTKRQTKSPMTILHRIRDLRNSCPRHYTCHIKHICLADDEIPGFMHLTSALYTVTRHSYNSWPEV